VRQLLHRCGREEDRRFNGPAAGPLDLQHHHDREQRIASEIEEVVGDADGPDIEQLFPDLDELILDGVVRLDGRLARPQELGETPSRGQTELLGQLPSNHLAVGPAGMDVTISTLRGTLNSASRVTANCRMSAAVAAMPGRSTTAAATSSPSAASGIPKVVT